MRQSADQTVPTIESTDASELHRWTWDSLRVIDGDQLEECLLQRVWEGKSTATTYLIAIGQLAVHRSYLQDATIDKLSRLIYSKPTGEIRDLAVRALLGIELWNLPSGTYLRLEELACQITQSTEWSRECIVHAEHSLPFLRRRVQSHQSLNSGAVVVPTDFVNRILDDPDSGFLQLGYGGHPDSLRSLIGYSADLRVIELSTFFVSGLDGNNGRIRVEWSATQRGVPLVACAASAKLLDRW